VLRREEESDEDEKDEAAREQIRNASREKMDVKMRCQRVN